MFGWRGEMCRLIMICLLVAIENITFVFFFFVCFLSSFLVFGAGMSSGFGGVYFLLFFFVLVGG
jgi:hypothetical protein